MDLDAATRKSYSAFVYKPARAQLGLLSILSLIHCIQFLVISHRIYFLLCSVRLSIQYFSVTQRAREMSYRPSELYRLQQIPIVSMFSPSCIRFIVYPEQCLEVEHQANCEYSSLLIIRNDPKDSDVAVFTRQILLCLDSPISSCPSFVHNIALCAQSNVSTSSCGRSYFVLTRHPVPSFVHIIALCAQSYVPFTFLVLKS